MHHWADLIERDALALTVLGVRDNCTEISMAFKAEAMSAAAKIRFYAETCDKIYDEIAPTDPSFLGLIHHEPVGVVGAIIPWNFPLMIGSWKLGPALTVGNSVVLKHSETGSLSILRLADLVLEAGVPPGVLNVVTGDGVVAGQALAMSMDVDVLAFTGSGAVGRRLLDCAARSNLKRVYLKLGGKSPHIIFVDAPDLEAAAQAVAGGIFHNAGQVCVAGSRLLVAAQIHDDFVAAVARHAAVLKVGDPLELSSQIGAINSERQLSQALEFVQTAQAEGGEVTLGGGRVLAETGGSYMARSIVNGVTQAATLFQKETFAPIWG